MAYEAEKNCDSCNGTGDKLGRKGGRAVAGFQQCPTCKGTGKTLDLTEYEDALTDGKKLRFVADKGKFTINGAEASRRMFMAALFTAMKYWERPPEDLERPQEYAAEAKSEEAEYGEDEEASDDV